MEQREFVIKTVPAMTVTGRRATVAAQPEVAAVVEPLFDEVAASINRAGGCAETGVGIYWDDDAGLHMLASYVSDGAVVPDAETVPLAENRAASTMHLGPMDTVAASWQALSLWCEQNGWTPHGACREVYLQAADPDDQSAWVVELQQPVARVLSPALSSGSTSALRGTMQHTITLRIDGTEHELSVDTRTTLLDALRERVGNISPKKGCDHGQCGSCTVLLDGRRHLTCLALAVAHDGAELVTAAGLAADGELHPVQQAFIAHDGFQCGYCTPGQVCSAVGMLDEVKNGHPSHVTEDLEAEAGLDDLSDDEIRERMSGNLCRCGAYVGILDAVRQAAGR